MSLRLCPKCGYRQESEEECLRCGVIFSKYFASLAGRSEILAEGSEVPDRPNRAGPFRRMFRILRWVLSGAGIVALVLILRPSTPPRIHMAPGAAQRAQEKILEFQSAGQEGQPRTLRMDESELNGWLGANLALAKDSGRETAGRPEESPKRAPVPAPHPGEPAGEPTFQPVQSSVKDVKIALRGETLHAYVAFELYGKSLSLELEGTLEVRDGYLRLVPRSGRLGSMPLMSSTLVSASERLFDAPQNRENFRLPAHIRDIRVDRDQLIIYGR